MEGSVLMLLAFSSASSLALLLRMSQRSLAVAVLAIQPVISHLLGRPTVLVEEPIVVVMLLVAILGFNISNPRKTAENLFFLWISHICPPEWSVLALSVVIYGTHTALLNVPDWSNSLDFFGAVYGDQVGRLSTKSERDAVLATALASSDFKQEFEAQAWTFSRRRNRLRILRDFLILLALNRLLLGTVLELKYVLLLTYVRLVVEID